MATTQQQKNQHLLWRAGFGVNTANTENLARVGHNAIYSVLELASATTPTYIDVADNAVKGLLMGIQQAVDLEKKPEETIKKRKQFRKQSANDIRMLNTSWLNEMVNSDAQLREKMSLFWHGHFACRNLNIFYQQLLLDEIRTNALGNFGDLLSGVSKSAGMLNFLNNQQNKKTQPNENFAREVMELFTMGRGNYTEKDVKEAARAFTGWSANINGEFVFHSSVHDDGEKNFLGKDGNFNGDDILNIILEQPKTATFITRKIYKYFVNENVDEDIVQQLSLSFYESNYDIKKLMRDIFTSDWFYDEKNIGSRIKSPVELLIGIRRTLPMQLEDESIQLLLQKALGQLLFYPPNVAGWPGGQTWIDSSTLMLRLRIPQLIKDDDTFFITPKTDDDVQMGMKENDNHYAKKLSGGGFRIAANVDWQLFNQQFKDTDDKDLYAAIEAMVLQSKKGSINRSVIEAGITSKSREEYIRNITIELMSTPEYQLC
ncbi:MAG: DUF1800 domain-containing protein [Bacteroidetes bacterium]|nr:DUF1800 domain-containing protein [Bacteroidota bacterium]